LPPGAEAYVSIGRDGRWQRPFPGALDEVRISDHSEYAADFAPPVSFSHWQGRTLPLPLSGPAPLFPGGRAGQDVIELGGRRHLFLDDALIASRENITFTPHPARVAERVMPGSGSFPLFFFHYHQDGPPERQVLADPAHQRGSFTTKPLRFEGNGLRLNVDTDAAGYAQLGFIDERGAPVPGFSVDECVYVNGDAIDYDVEWLGKNGATTKDVSALAGKMLQLVVRLRGTSLYALQFVKR
jgi:hypothetical protein